MKKLGLILSLVIFSLSSSGCSLFGGNKNATETQPSPSPENTPKPTESFPGKTPSGNTGSKSTVGGLIPSTKPGDVNLDKGRSDPFGVVPVKPVVTKEPGTGESTTTPPETPETGSKPPQGTEPPTGTPKGTPQGTPKGTPKGKPGSGKQKPKPVPVTSKCLKDTEAQIIPIHAQAVQVLGILNLPNGPVAIVKAPEEKVTRTVAPGSGLSTGVRVKRISGNSVVLEQYGIEVVRSIGELPDLPSKEELAAQTPGEKVKTTSAAAGLVLINARLEPETSPTTVNGTFCNDTSKDITVTSLDLQFEDKKDGEIINSVSFKARGKFYLKPGQRAKFTGSLTTDEKGEKVDQEDILNGKKSGDVNIILKGWS